MSEDEDAEMQRKKWSQHRLTNAVNKITFVMYVEFLAHLLLNSCMPSKKVFWRMVHLLLVLDKVPTPKKAALDNLAIAFHKSHSRQTYRKEYPAIDFTSNGGITNLTNITAL